MDKNRIVSQIKSQFQHELGKAKKNFDSAADYRHQDDMKQEGKYDTRAIEAGYLASAVQKRVHDLEQDLKLLAEMDLELANSKENISMGSLVELSYNGLTRLYFLSSTAGGSIVQLDGIVILVISIFSPLGQELINTRQGDLIEVEIEGGKNREYKVMSIS